MTLRRIAPAAARLRDDASGATIVEFALVAPVFLMTLLGLMDLSYNLYTTTLLEGAIQQAGRNATIEGAGGRAAKIDARVRDAVDDLVLDAEIKFDRRAYVDFSDIGRPEDFNDLNRDGDCNDDEPFEDANGNGRWDLDRGKGDMGGARDAVLYTVTVKYPRGIPAMAFLGIDPTVQAQARTVLRNQPYGQQNKASAVGNCS